MRPQVHSVNSRRWPNKISFPTNLSEAKISAGVAVPLQILRRFVLVSKIVSDSASRSWVPMMFKQTLLDLPFEFKWRETERDLALTGGHFLSGVSFDGRNLG